MTEALDETVVIINLGEKTHPVAFVSVKVAEVFASQKYKPGAYQLATCAKPERLTNGRVIVGDRVYQLDRTTDQQWECQRILSVLPTKHVRTLYECYGHPIDNESPLELALRNLVTKSDQLQGN